ncbi:DUF4429 domain-containing protein [Actinorugispora endophytica]|uniref:Putative oligomerization/nucleic acid binding protein n=1 Tax=Actinorugispora endophytica TaxID=1605990 RepID=A0A4R6UD99_9ACTN|nr:DUF4429 domain-containing protein [Actinorugispora endophytica]TDQ43916.1 putative oligomerization/nucleic acid binding protein [Actinorugispora endophytica]
MAEVFGSDGTWSLDGDVVRIVPGTGRRVGGLRRALGEIEVPVQALAGVAHEPGRRGGRLRLRLRPGADPLTQVAAGRLPEASDPYRLAVAADRNGVSEYFADELRTVMALEQVPSAPSDRYLMPGPSVPLTATSPDGSVEFDGDRIRLAWRWGAESSKSSAGHREFTVGDLVGVDWEPAAGLGYGRLSFRREAGGGDLLPEHDPYSLRLWGFDKENWGTLLVAAAVAARLRHPYAPPLPEGGPVRELPAAPADSDSEVLLRRLRELGELHRDGVLTDEEFTEAKKPLLARLRAANSGDGAA